MDMHGLELYEYRRNEILGDRPVMLAEKSQFHQPTKRDLPSHDSVKRALANKDIRILRLASAATNTLQQRKELHPFD